MKIVFKESAAQQIRKLGRSIRIRILRKLQFYASQKNPLRWVEPLKDPRFGNWRFRIGNYRILFDIKDNTIIVLKVGHRRDVYK